MPALRAYREGALAHGRASALRQSPEHAMDDPRLTGTEHRVLVVLAFLARNSFPDVRASHAEIAIRATATTRTVRRAMAKLEKLGYARQIEKRHIVLTYETRVPFQLESGGPPKGRKRAKRTEMSASKADRGVRMHADRGVRFSIL